MRTDTVFTSFVNSILLVFVLHCFICSVYVFSFPWNIALNSWWTYYGFQIGNSIHPTSPNISTPVLLVMQKPHTPHILPQIKHNLILLSTNWRNSNSNLLPSLVFTITAFEIGLFQEPETPYPRVEKVQVCKIVQFLHPFSDPQLNLSLALLICLRLLYSQKNNKPFSNLYFAPYIVHIIPNLKSNLTNNGLNKCFIYFQHLFEVKRRTHLQIWMFRYVDLVARIRSTFAPNHCTMWILSMTSYHTQEN